jgi:hypothetical protein
MGKRGIVGLFAAMSVIALWWTDAGAATCLQYRTLGGSSVCSKWSTKGVLLELTYKQPCGPDEGGEGGSGTACSAVAEAVTNNSIAFCAHPTNPSGLPVTKVQCTENVRFFGADEGCDPKHEQDGTGDGGKGHDKGKHGCTTTFLLERLGGCELACSTAGFGPPLDVTPITMDTNVAATVAPAGEGEGGGAASPCTFTEEGATSCTFTEHCSINPNQIAFNAIRPYQCNLTSAGGPPPEEPCEDCEAL